MRAMASKFPPKPDIARIIDNMDPPIGFGLFLIKQLADQVEFKQRTYGGHVVKMAILKSGRDEKAQGGDAAQK
jgi:anti-sigma regulatory factor (Ser/Thr protein kinase)